MTNCPHNFCLPVKKFPLFLDYLLFIFSSFLPGVSVAARSGSQEDLEQEVPRLRHSGRGGGRGGEFGRRKGGEGGGGKGREKEEWFQHFLSASRPEAQSSVSREENVGKMVETPEELLDFPGGLKTRTLLEYSTYMTQVIGPQSCSPTLSPCHSDQGSPTAHTKERSPGGQQGATWVNSLVGRIFWDFLREKYWTDLVAQKIQKKLSKIKLPYFMNELTLADLDMGTCLPQVLSTSTPKLDRRGLWLEMEVVYTGCLQMTLQTKMNLCKLGKDGEDEAHSVLETHQPRLCALADSDEESSSAGSSDEEEASPFEPSTSRKILRFVDKIAKSKYFQKATENEFIRKKIAEVSNMPLILSVEVLELSGILAINVPPPPTDRIWYSFRVPPRLELHVRPALGEREVTFTHVTEWIERKLQCEFQKVLVMPNMDDLYLPLMTSGLENPPVSHQSSVHSSSHQSSTESQEHLSE
uniref:SMP-LTD domain-containing protein n=1 Tax=Gasterosteus aculeatus aculeatus TaxID=481459 RepID=A0AAQ4QN36_GASAC